MLSVVIAFFLYGLLHSADPLFSGAAGEINAERMIIMPKHDMMFGRLPQSHINYLESLEGITNIAWIDMLSMDINSMTENIPIFAISKDYFKVMDRFEASPEEKEAFFSNRRGALAGKAAADIKGWKVGDLVSIPTFSEKNDGSNIWEFVIEGIYTTNPAADELGIMVRNEYVEEARIANKGTVSMILFNLDDPSKADEVSNIIDNNYKTLYSILNNLSFDKSNGVGGYYFSYGYGPSIDESDGMIILSRINTPTIKFTKSFSLSQLENINNFQISKVNIKEFLENNDQYILSIN